MKKLIINKITITRLSPDEMTSMKAGVTLPQDTACQGTELYSCPQTVCCAPTHNPDYSTCNTIDSVFQCPLMPEQ